MRGPRERVLVVDDERDMAESCAYFLDRAGYEAVVATAAEEALELLREQRFSVVVSDVRMPRMSGIALMEAIRATAPDVEVVLITGYPEVETAVEAMRMGALDYITKPFTEREFLERVERAFGHRRVRAANPALADRLRRGRGGRRLVHRSRAFAELVDALERVARTEATVLIRGESGTGKELLAHHLHDVSPRAGRPFVPVDCATIPENLVESELFGHVRGAFSGAERDRPGLLQVADGGTLFLDEVGELPLAFQPKLLRVIQERQIRRVGSERYEDIDVRIVCATNRNLDEMVRAGAFREDLFYRLDVVRLDVPPLRERPEDVEPLVRHFLSELRESGQCDYVAVTSEALAVLQAQPWPGNVRQLRNVIERACALGCGDVLGLEDLPAELREASVPGARDRGGVTFQEMKARRVAALEESYLRSLLERNRGNVTRSAQEAGMARSALQKLLQRYGIRSADYRR